MPNPPINPNPVPRWKFIPIKPKTTDRVIAPPDITPDQSRRLWESLKVPHQPLDVRQRAPTWLNFAKSKVEIRDDGKLYVMPDKESLTRYQQVMKAVEAVRPAWETFGQRMAAAPQFKMLGIKAPAPQKLVSSTMPTAPKLAIAETPSPQPSPYKGEEVTGIMQIANVVNPATRMGLQAPTTTTTDQEAQAYAPYSPFQTLDEQGGFVIDPGTPGQDWNIEYRREKGKVYRRIVLNPMVSMTPLTTPEEVGKPQGQQFGMPEGDPESTMRGGFGRLMGNPWVQLGQSALQGGLPAALVGGAILGPLGAALGGAAGTIGMLIQNEQMRQMQETAKTAEELASAKRAYDQSLPGVALTVLNAPAETAKRLIGTGVQGIASLVNPQQYGFDKSKSFGENLAAAWNAAELTYTAANIDVRGVFGVEHLADAIVKGKPAYTPWGGWQDNAQFVDWDTGPAPMPGVNAIAWARQQIINGANPEQVKALAAATFGAPGQIRDLALNITLDPLNFIGAGQRGALKLYARFAKDEAMAKALSATPHRLKMDKFPFPTIAYTGGLVKTLENYRRIITSEIPFRSDFVAARDLNWLQKLYVGKTMAKLAETGTYAETKGIKGLFTLEPMSEAKENMHQSLNFWQSQLNNRMDVNDPLYADKITAAVLSTIGSDPSKLPKDFAGRDAYVGALQTLEGRVHVRSLGEAESYTDLLDGFKNSRLQAGAIETAARALNDTPAGIFARIKAGDGKAVLREFADAEVLTQSGKGAKAKGERLKIGAADATADDLVAIQKLFKEVDKDGRMVPFNNEQYKAALFSIILENTGLWAAKTFQVQPPGFAQRLAGAVKAVESTLLMGPNLGFLMNNVWNGEVTMMARGVWGLTGVKAGIERMRHMGLDPSRLRAGASAADLSELNDAEAWGVKAYKVGERELTAGFQQTDLVHKITELGHKISSKMPATAAAQKVERWQSARAVVKGFFDFRNHNWRRGKAIDYMSPELEGQLRGFGIDPAYVYAAVESGANPREIRGAIFAAAPKPILHQYIGQVARDLGLADDEITRLLSIDGLDQVINDELGKLPDKPTDGHIRKAFDNVRARGEQSVNEAAQVEAEQFGAHAMEAIKAGDVGAALDSIDGIETRLFDTYAYTMLRHDEEWAKIEQQPKKPLRDFMIEQLREKDAQSWKTYFDYEDAVYRGIETGMKDAGLNLSDNWLTAARDKRARVETFIGERNKILAQFFADKRTDEAWIQTQNVLNNLYTQLADDQLAINTRVDAYLSAEFKRAFGDTTGDAFANWRETVRKFNDEDMRAVAAFRDSMKDVKGRKIKGQRWLAFNKERTTRRRMIMIQGMEARHRVMEVMPIKPGIETTKVVTTDFETVNGRTPFAPERAPVGPAPVHVPTPVEVLPDVNAARAAAGQPPIERAEAIPPEELRAAQDAALAEEMVSPQMRAEGEARVPVMITRDMRQRLYDLGYTSDVVNAMTPLRANEILSAGTTAVRPVPVLANMDRAALKATGWDRGVQGLLRAVNKDRKVKGLDPYGTAAEVPLTEAVESMNMRLEARRADVARKMAETDAAKRLADGALSATDQVAKVVQADADVNVAAAELVAPLPGDGPAAAPAWTRQRFADEVAAKWYDAATPDYGDKVAALMALMDAQAGVWSRTFDLPAEEFYSLWAGVIGEAPRAIGPEKFAQWASETGFTQAEVDQAIKSGRFVSPSAWPEKTPEQIDRLNAVVEEAKKYPAARGLTDQYGTPLFQMEPTLTPALSLEGRGGRAPKAAFELVDGWQRTIRGFEARDTSSFVHEAAHGFLYDLYDASHVSKQALDDVGTFRDWLKTEHGLDVALVDGRIVANSDTLPTGWEAVERDGVTVVSNRRGEIVGQGTERSQAIRMGLDNGAQEEWARGFERYMVDGYAPTPQLRQLFERFKKWLVEVYKRIKGTDIDINLTPEMRAVYDRLLTEVEPAYPMTNVPHGLRVDQFVKQSDYRSAYSGQYVQGESILASSKTVPSTVFERLPLRPGQWVIDDAYGGIYGHEIEQVRLLDPDTLRPTEHMVEGNEQGRGWDADRYAAWLREGRNAPPIRVVEHIDGGHVVTDGHRRLAAAKQAGFPVLAIVSPLMDTGTFDSGGRMMQTGMTYEGALLDAFRRGDAVDLEQVVAVRAEVMDGQYPNLKRKFPDLFTGPDVSDGSLIGAHVAVTGLDEIGKVIDVFTPGRAKLVLDSGREITVPRKDITAVASTPAEIEAMKPSPQRTGIVSEPVVAPEVVQAPEQVAAQFQQMRADAFRTSPQQAAMFPLGEDLPLVSGAGRRGVVESFAPAEAVPVERLPGFETRPEFGAVSRKGAKPQREAGPMFGEVAPVPATFVKPKAPWEIRRDEYALDSWQEELERFRDRPDILDTKDRKTEIEHFKEIHAGSVNKAIDDGRPVPAEVLADYPVLEKKAQRRWVKPVQSDLVPVVVDNKRVDVALRASIDEMTTADRAEAIQILRDQILVNPVSNAPSVTAYHLVAKRAIQVHSDVDGLKWVNDTFGHGASDALLRAKAQALREEGIETYHISGDEFYAQFDNVDEAQAAMQRVRDRLNHATVRWVNPDGSTHEATGVRFSYGYGTDATIAEAGLAADKAARIASGERSARGERPGGMVEPVEGAGVGAGGRAFGGGVATGGEVAAGAAKEPWQIRRDEWLQGDIRKQREAQALAKVEDSVAGIGRDKLVEIGYIKPDEATAEPWLERVATKKAEWVSRVLGGGIKNLKKGQSAIEFLSKPWNIFKDSEGETRLRKAALEYVRGRSDGWLEKGEGFDDPRVLTLAKHEAAVGDALEKGLPVPAEVLADYPFLVTKAEAATGYVAVAAAREIGRGAFARGVPRVPPSTMPSEGWKEWLTGWDEANLAADRPVFVRNNGDIGKVVRWDENGDPVVAWSDEPSKPYATKQWREIRARDFEELMGTRLGAARKSTMTAYADEYGWKLAQVELIESPYVRGSRLGERGNRLEWVDRETGKYGTGTASGRVEADGRVFIQGDDGQGYIKQSKEVEYAPSQPETRVSPAEVGEELIQPSGDRVEVTEAVHADVVNPPDEAFKVGDRVSLQDGKHGVISSVDTLQWQSIYGTDAGQSVYVRVKTDVGTDVSARMGELQHEVGEAPAVVRWPEVNGTPHDPADFERIIQYDLKKARSARDSARRRRTPVPRAEDIRKAEGYEKSAAEARRVIAEWTAQNPEEAAKYITPDPVVNAADQINPVATATGVRMQYNKAKSGVEIIFDDKPDQATLDELHAAGFRWSQPQKLWWAKQSERTIAAAKKFAGVVEGGEVSGKLEVVSADVAEVQKFLDAGRGAVLPDQVTPRHVAQTAFQKGDRVKWTTRDGKELTGTIDLNVYGTDTYVSVNVDQIVAVRGVPIGRIENVPLERVEMVEPRPVTPAEVVPSPQPSPYPARTGAFGGEGVMAGRENIARRIADSTRARAPDIVEVTSRKGDDGNWYRNDFFPRGVEGTSEWRVDGFAYRSPEGQTYGTLVDTREELIARHMARQNKDVGEFYDKLLAMPNEKLVEQAQYFLKETPKLEEVSPSPQPSPLLGEGVAPAFKPPEWFNEDYVSDSGYLRVYHDTRSRSGERVYMTYDTRKGDVSTSRVDTSKELSAAIQRVVNKDRLITEAEAVPVAARYEVVRNSRTRLYAVLDREQGGSFIQDVTQAEAERVAGQLNEAAAVPVAHKFNVGDVVNRGAMESYVVTGYADNGRVMVEPKGLNLAERTYSFNEDELTHVTTEAVPVQETVTHLTGEVTPSGDIIVTERPAYIRAKNDIMRVKRWEDEMPVGNWTSSPLVEYRATGSWKPATAGDFTEVGQQQMGGFRRKVIDSYRKEFEGVINAQRLEPTTTEVAGLIPEAIPVRPGDIGNVVVPPAGGGGPVGAGRPIAAVGVEPGAAVEGPVGGVNEPGTELRPGAGVGEGGLAAGRRAGAGGVAGAEPERVAPSPQPSPYEGEGATLPPVVHARNTPQAATGNNYHITASDHLGAGGKKTKYRENIEAIRLLKQLEAEGRKATPEEQEVLVRYVGWGGLAEVFDNKNAARTHWDYKTRRDLNNEWYDQYTEVKDLLTPEEYAAARASTTNAHYTSFDVISGMWQAVQRMGYDGGKVLEPAAGVGHFIGAMPPELFAKSKVVTVEMDTLTGRILNQLYQGTGNHISPYQDLPLPKNYFDLAISNVPFGNFGVADAEFLSRPHWLRGSIHNYYFAKALDQVRPGGMIAFITSSFTMDAPTSQRVREWLHTNGADFVGAIRLPDTAFKQNAGTEVMTDVIFLRKRLIGDTPTDTQWFKVVDWTGQDGKVYQINEYYRDHPEMMIGNAAESTMYKRFDEYSLRSKTDFQKDMNAVAKLTLKLDNPDDLPRMLNETIDRLPEDVIRTRTHLLPTEMEAEIVGRKRGAAGERRKPNAIYKNDQGQIRQYTVEGTLKGLEKPADVKPADWDQALARYPDYVTVRDAYQNVIDALREARPETDVRSAQQSLDAAYDAYVKKHGRFNERSNRRLFADDPDYPLMLSLEKVNETTGKIEKETLLTKIKPRGLPTTAENAHDALAISLLTRGSVDFDQMTRMTGKDVQTLADELGALVYHDPEAGWVTDDEYLSGNVRQKLAQAELLAKADPDYDRNVAALQKAQPAWIGYDKMKVKLGAGWIKPAYVQEFVAHLANYGYDATRAQWLRYIPETGDWVMAAPQWARGSNQMAAKWSTNRRSGIDLVDSILSGRKIEVRDTYKNDAGVEVSVINAKETEAARLVATRIENEFDKWVWTDEARRADLEKTYNDTFTSNVNRKYDGRKVYPDQRLPGMSETIEPLRDAQLTAIWRGVHTPNFGLFHDVGAGKTRIMIGIGMEQRRMGLRHNLMYVVPKDNYTDFSKEFHQMYPTANILELTARDISDEARRTLMMAKIAAGEYDAVLVPHSTFTLIPVRDETFNAYKQERIDSLKILLDELNDQAASYGSERDLRQQDPALDRSIRRLKNQIEKEGEQLRTPEKAAAEQAAKEARVSRKKGKTVKEKEKAIARKEAKVEEQFLKLEARRDRGLTFEDLGVDQMFVDEAHKFKNLPIDTNMATHVRGLGSTGKSSQRAEDLYMKLKYLQSRGGGSTFATGTPLSNSGSELYTMMKYLYSDRLKAMGIESFNAWAAMFANIYGRPERSATGGAWTRVNRFREYQNGRALLPLLFEFSDIQTADMLSLERPAFDIINHVIPQTEYQIRLNEDFQRRWKNIKPPRPGEKAEDYAFTIMNDAKDVALDIRLYDAAAADAGDSKVNTLVKNVDEIYKQTQDYNGAQLIFLNRGVYEHTMAAEEGAAARLKLSIYNDVRDKLIKAGVPKEEIAYIQDYPLGGASDKAVAKAMAARRELFEAVNDGKVRIVFGTYEGLGTGVNLQRRLFAVHEVDVPYKPSELTQSEGRILRPGNLHKAWDKSVQIHRYMLENSGDSFNWNLIVNKAKLMNQIFSGDVTIDSFETPDAGASGFDMSYVSTWNDPRALEYVDVSSRYTLLEMARNEFADRQKSYERRLARAQSDIPFYEKQAAEYAATAEKVAARRAEKFGATLNGKAIEKVGEAGDEVIAYVKKNFEAMNEENAKQLGAVWRTIGDTSSGFEVKVTARRNEYRDGKRIVDRPWFDVQIAFRDDPTIIYRRMGGFWLGEENAVTVGQIVNRNVADDITIASQTASGNATAARNSVAAAEAGLRETFPEEDEWKKLSVRMPELQAYMDNLQTVAAEKVAEVDGVNADTEASMKAEDLADDQVESPIEQTPRQVLYQVGDPVPAAVMGIPAPNGRGFMGGTTTARGADPTKTYDLRWRLVEMDDLIASHDSVGNVNAAYPPELQPRDRANAVNMLQVREIASKFESAAYLDDVRSIDRGAPIVGADGVVESGNGRTLALRMVADNAPEKYADYRDKLIARAGEYGFAPEQVGQMTRPVLVRERPSTALRSAQDAIAERMEFARAANVTPSAAMSASELAQRDARILSPVILNSLTIGESQTIEQALRSPANIDAVRAFVDALPETERGDVVDAAGNLSQNGIKRMTAALFAKTYPGEAGQRLVRVFFESTDNDIKRIANGMMASLGDVARAEGLIASGSRYAEFSIANDLAISVDKLATLRAEGTPVAHYLGQMQLFEKDLTPFQTDVLVTLDDLGRSGKKIGILLRDYASRVKASADPHQISMFAIEAPKKDTLWQLSKQALWGVDTPTGGLELYKMAEGESVPTSEGNKVVKQVTPKQVTVENPNGTTTAIPIIKPGSLPLPPGIVNEIGSMPTPYASAAMDVWQKQTMPVIDALESRMIEGLQSPYVKTGQTLDEPAKLGLNRWLDQQYGNMSNTNLGAMKWGEWLRDAALLNYSRRYKYNTLLGMVFPYEFWTTQSMMKWALHSIDKPSLVASYFRINKFLNTEVTREGTPSRLAGRIKIPLPFLPDWMGGGIFIDPMKIGLPIQNFIYPWEQFAEQEGRLTAKADRILTGWQDDDQQDADQVRSALESHSGTLWESAIAEAKKQDPNLDVDGVDLAFSVLSPHLPLSMAYNQLNGHPERNSPVPLTRYARAVSNALGVGDNLVNGVTRTLGLPVFDQWSDYRIDREISNMAADGLISADEARTAMIERKGQAFDIAVAREATMNFWQTGFGGLFGSAVGVYPEGEKKQRELGLLYSAAWQAQNNGDTGSITKFFNEHPEYEARLALYDNKDDRLRNFLVDKVWEKWANMPHAYRLDVQQAFGNDFDTMFLNKDTRSYSSIPIETLQQWAATMGMMIPNGPDVKPLPVEWTDPITAKQIEGYYTLREAMFNWPNVSDAQTEYFNLDHEKLDFTGAPAAVTDFVGLVRAQWPNIEQVIGEYLDLPKGSTERRQYKAAHPELTAYWNAVDRWKAQHPSLAGYVGSAGKMQNAVAVRVRDQFLQDNPAIEVYWDWRRSFLGQYPAVQPYLDETAKMYAQNETPAASDWYDAGYTIPPELSNIAVAWIFGGRRPNSSAMKKFTAAWNQAGQPYGSVEEWVMREMALQ